MSGTSVFQAGQQQQFDSTDHYHDHLKRMARTLTRLPDVPQYPNVHTVFNKKVAHEEEYEAAQEQQQPERPSPGSSKATKKVHVTDRRDIIGEQRNGSLVEVREENVDWEADSYIQKKHKGFELQKWKTFKLP